MKDNFFEQDVAWIHLQYLLVLLERLGVSYADDAKTHMFGYTRVAQ